MEDVAPIKKLRIGHDGKGHRPDWFVEKVDSAGNLYLAIFGLFLLQLYIFDLLL